jgi:tungstate transport system substrate-binding protein
MNKPSPRRDAIQMSDLRRGDVMSVTLALYRISLSCALLLAACGRAPVGGRALRLGTTTTVRQSGMLAVAESSWREGPLATVIAPSGQILASAAQGDLDVVLTHAPALEAKFLGTGAALERCPFVTSDFVIVGPASDPAAVRGAADAAEAFRRIAARGALFVSRGDSSGTHEREVAVWRRAGVAPWGHGWYLESGTDQTTTLRLADERGAYALADLPTLATLRDLALRPLLGGDSMLVNRYTLYLVRTPSPHPAARRFLAWALERWRPALLGIRLADGTPAFRVAPAGCTTS